MVGGGLDARVVGIQPVQGIGDAASVLDGAVDGRCVHTRGATRTGGYPPPPNASHRPSVTVSDSSRSDRYDARWPSHGQVQVGQRILPARPTSPCAIASAAATNPPAISAALSYMPGQIGSRACPPRSNRRGSLAHARRKRETRKAGAADRNDVAGGVHHAQGRVDGLARREHLETVDQLGWPQLICSTYPSPRYPRPTSTVIPHRSMTGSTSRLRCAGPCSSWFTAAINVLLAVTRDHPAGVRGITLGNLNLHERLAAVPVIILSTSAAPTSKWPSDSGGRPDRRPSARTAADRPTDPQRDRRHRTPPCATIATTGSPS
jgi:hypothetical protein